MPNIAEVLKDEIARISRREIKKATAGLHRSSAAYRKEIAALKRRSAGLERALKESHKRTKTPTDTGEAAEATGHRFSAQGFRTLRRRLGLSAPQLGKLLGVSEQSIYNWETGHTMPRRGLMPKIVALRAWGKREAHQRLLALS